MNYPTNQNNKLDIETDNSKYANKHVITQAHSKQWSQHLLCGGCFTGAAGYNTAFLNDKLSFCIGAIDEPTSSFSGPLSPSFKLQKACLSRSRLCE